MVILTPNPNNLETAVKEHKENKIRAITLFVIGLLITAISAAAIAITCSSILLPILFSATLVAGLVASAHLLKMDWNPYHLLAFKPRLESAFKAYHDNRAFLRFCAQYDHPAKLRETGWINNVTETHYRNLCLFARDQDDDIVTTKRNLWNQFVTNPASHTAKCCER